MSCFSRLRSFIFLLQEKSIKSNCDNGREYMKLYVCAVFATVRERLRHAMLSLWVYKMHLCFSSQFADRLLNQQFQQSACLFPPVHPVYHRYDILFLLLLRFSYWIRKVNVAHPIDKCVYVCVCVSIYLVISLALV